MNRLNKISWSVSFTLIVLLISGYTTINAQPRSGGRSSIYMGNQLTDNNLVIGNYIGTDLAGNILEFSSSLLLPSVTHTPVVGAVTSSAAKFVVRTDEVAGVKMMLSTDGDNWTNPVYSNQLTTSIDKDYFAILDVAGLNPNTEYFYQPVVSGQSVSDFSGKFKTFPITGESAVFSFLFGSCQQEAFNDPKSNIGGIFPDMAAEDALFFLHQGDWGYPDTTDSEQGDSLNYFAKDMDLQYSSYKTRYDPNFPMAELLKVIPVDFVYDDHDFVNNNSDFTYKSQGGDNSIQVYQEAFPHYPLPSASNGLWHKFSCGDVDLFVVDNRTQRDPNMNGLTMFGDRLVFTANYLDNHTILGDEQMTWLIDQLKTSTATWKFISSGTPFNPATRGIIDLASMLHGTAYDPILNPATGQPASMAYLTEEFSDSWRGFPASIYKLLSGIITNEITNVIFLSGDTHNSGIDDGENSLIPEIMAGPLDRSNSQIVALSKEMFKMVGFNKGGHTYDNAKPPDLGNAYGKVKVFGADSVVLNIVSETKNILAKHTVLPGVLPRRVAGVVVPGGLEFGSVPGNEQGGSALIAISTSIDTFKITGISVVPVRGNSQIVSLSTAASLESGKAEMLQFGFIPIGNVGDTTQALVMIGTNDQLNPVIYIGAQGVIGVPTEVLDDFDSESIPVEYQLFQNYPNPFNPVTKLSFILPVAEHVSIKIYDLHGREVKILIDTKFAPGFHEINFDAGHLASGMYIYKLVTKSFSESKKMVLMR